MPNSDPQKPAEANLSSLARHSLVYSIAPLAQRLVAMGLVRLYTGILNTAQKGVVDLSDLLFTALIQISGTNVLSAVMRFYFDQKDDRDRRTVVSSAIVFLSIVSWTLVALAIALRHPLAEYLFVTNDPNLAGDDLPNCLIVTLLTIPLALSSEAAFRYLQIQQRSGLVTTLRVSKSTLEMGLKVLFLVGLKYGVVGFLLATLIGELLTNLFLTSWVIRRVGMRFSWAILSPMLRYAGPLVLVGLCQFALNMSDRLLIKWLCPESVAMGWVGVYGQGFMIAWMIQLIVVGSFMQIWQPWIFGVSDAARRTGFVKRVSTWALFAVGTASLGVILGGRELVRVLSGQVSYYDAFRVVPWVCAGYVFFALNGLSQVPMFIAKRTWPMLWLNASAVAVKLALGFLLIPRYGYIGAAVATLVTFMVLGISGHVLAGRLVGARFEHGRMAAMLALVLAVMAATLWIDASLTSEYTALFTPWTGVKALTFLALVVFVWRGLLHPDERRQCVDQIRAKLGR